jgi:preprotein translocase subunit SecE
MANVSEYIKESYIELTQKVTWPTWRELQNSAILVLIAAIIIALLIAVMDQGIMLVLNKFYSSLA